MTNVNAPFGLRPVRRLDGAALSFQLERRQIAYNNSHQIATGDPVISLNTGYIDIYANGGSTIDGVFWGCEYPDPNNNNTPIWRPMWNAVSGLTSSQVVYAWIIRDKNIAFEIQAGSGGAPFADIMDNSDIVVGTPNSTTGRSGAYLDSTHDTTATFPLKIVAMGQGVSTTNQAGTTNGYDPLTGYNIVQVALNTFDLYNTTGI